MGVVEVLDPVAPARAGGWKVDVSRGERHRRERVRFATTQDFTRDRAHESGGPRKNIVPHYLSASQQDEHINP